MKDKTLNEKLIELLSGNYEGIKFINPSGLRHLIKLLIGNGHLLYELGIKDLNFSLAEIGKFNVKLQRKGLIIHSPTKKRLEMYY